MYQFSGVVKCINCGKNYKGRTERGNRVYICSTYSRSSEKCFRYTVHESDLIKIIEGHLKLKGIEVKGVLTDNLLYIKVDSKNRGFEIYYDDKTKSIVSNDDKLGIKYKL